MEQFFADNSLYVVLLIVLIIWAGLAVFMLRLERRVTDVQESLRSVAPAEYSAPAAQSGAEDTSADASASSAQ